jgi:hypothetical protein
MLEASDVDHAGTMRMTIFFFSRDYCFDAKVTTPGLSLPEMVPGGSTANH